MMKTGWVLRSVLGILTAGVIVLAGCEDSDHDVQNIAGTGRSVVRGNILDLGAAVPAAAVAGAHVYLEGTDIEATVGENGQFYFSKVPAGTYTLVIEYDGKVVEIEITVPDNMEVIVKDIVGHEDGTLDAKVIVRPFIIGVSGNWVVTRLFGPPGVNQYIDPMILSQSGKTLTGALGLIAVSTPARAYNLTGSLNGPDISLVGILANPANAVRLTMNGRVTSSGESMSGTWDDGSNSGTWTAERGELEIR